MIARSTVTGESAEAPAVARNRMVLAVAASTIAHALAIVGALALVRPYAERVTTPLVLPVSLVFRPGGGGGGGGATVQSPAPPQAAAAAEIARPEPALTPPARPKPSANPKAAARRSTPDAGTHDQAATSGASGSLGGATGGGGGAGGSGFSGASPGYGVNPLPPYPVAARRLGIQGEVLLRVFVAADGRPTNVTVLTSSGSDLLDASAVETVRSRWRFIPATRNGAPVEDTVQVPIRFRQTDG